MLKVYLFLPDTSTAIRETYKIHTVNKILEPSKILLSLASLNYRSESERLEHLYSYPNGVVKFIYHSMALMTKYEIYKS